MIFRTEKTSTFPLLPLSFSPHFFYICITINNLLAGRASNTAN